MEVDVSKTDYITNPRIRAKRRFKALVRCVIANMYWMSVYDDDQLGENVQKNVFMLTKRKKGVKDILLLSDKAILNKPTQYRTEADKKRLNKIIENLKMFKRYPANVKEQLASACYYVYYGPGRVVVRQNHSSDGLYFILTGEVGVFKTTLDPVTNTYFEQHIGTMAEGSMFGEVALLHDIPRQATIITSKHCELLKLMRDDFNRILKSTIQKKWDEITASLSLFSYFSNWNAMAKRECCIMSKMKTYLPGETILSYKDVKLNYVYFITRGKCQILEEMKILVYRTAGGAKKFALYSTSNSESGDVGSSISTLKSMEEILVKKGTTSFCAKRIGSRPIWLQSHLNQLNLGATSSNLGRGSSVPHIETRFMQVCYLNETACFGFGEITETRRIVAVTKVRCLIIPRYWLYRQNTANIWTRIKLFLHNRIPSTEQVFMNFLKERLWRMYKRKLVESVVRKPPVNCLSNVPYSIRINQPDDFY